MNSETKINTLLRGFFTRSEEEFLRQSPEFRKALGAWDGTVDSYVQIARQGSELLLRDYTPPRPYRCYRLPESPFAPQLA
jgi:hypothetical protein